MVSEARHTHKEGQFKAGERKERERDKKGHKFSPFNVLIRVSRIPLRLPWRHVPRPSHGAMATINHWPATANQRAVSALLAANYEVMARNIFWFLLEFFLVDFFLKI